MTTEKLKKNLLEWQSADKEFWKVIEKIKTVAITDPETYKMYKNMLLE